MQIIRKADAIFKEREDGSKIRRFLFDEYELHDTTIPPGTIQAWHSHEKIEEALLVIDGPMDILFIEAGETKKETLVSGDLVRFEKTAHTVENNTEKPARFFVLKMVPEGKDKKHIFLNDKKIIKKE
ncbi:MAG: cupin domain-containing protein [Candidatus Aenigmarchaeota archaeon]|nr:cupin domain-containing protein [Candidatus Aenigmarchaeota archaeon]